MAEFTGFVTALDFWILDWIQEKLVCPFLNAILVPITLLGDWCIPWFIAAIVLLCMKKYRKWGILMLLSLTLEIIVTDVVLKMVFSRIRPFAVNQAVELLIKAPSSYSFPSGHTGSAFACAVSLIFTRKKRLYIPGLILALLTAFSRTYLYVHYPSDVLAGMLVGIACALITYQIALPYFPHSDLSAPQRR